MSMPAQRPAPRTRDDAVADERRRASLQVLAERARARPGTRRSRASARPEAHGRGERIAAEGRAVLAGTEHAEHVAVADDGRDGHDAAAERLAEQVEVGHDADEVARERRADAAEARLDLVGDEQHVVARCRSRAPRGR